MIRIAIFGASEHLMGGPKKLYLTLFAGMELHRPTLAKRLLERKYSPRSHRGWFGLPKDVIFVACGGVDIREPSLADEFVDLRVLLSAGLLTREEWDEAVYRLAAGDHEDYISFAIFGAIEAQLASKEEERNRIEAHRQAGLLSEREADRIDSMVGRSVGQVATDIAEMATHPFARRSPTA